MKKPVVIGIVVAVVVLAIGGLLFAKLGSDSDGTKETSSDNMKEMTINDNSMKPTDTSSSSSTPTATSSVEIKDFAFSPASITVKVGTKVTWTNQDSVGHDVTSDSGSDGPGSELLSKGESYSFTFTKAGKYSYHCTPHPYMKGTVTVTE